MPTLTKLKRNELKKYIPSVDFSIIEKSGVPVYKIEVTDKPLKEDNPLIEVEVSLRRGERVGLFSQKR